MLKSAVAVLALTCGLLVGSSRALIDSVAAEQRAAEVRPALATLYREYAALQLTSPLLSHDPTRGCRGSMTSCRFSWIANTVVIRPGGNRWGGSESHLPLDRAILWSGEPDSAPRRWAESGVSVIEVDEMRQPIPEPAILLLLALGLAVVTGLCLRDRWLQGRGERATDGAINGETIGACLPDETNPGLMSDRGSR